MVLIKPLDNGVQFADSSFLLFQLALSLFLLCSLHSRLVAVQTRPRPPGRRQRHVGGFEVQAVPVPQPGCSERNTVFSSGNLNRCNTLFPVLHDWSGNHIALLRNLRSMPARKKAPFLPSVWNGGVVLWPFCTISKVSLSMIASWVFSNDKLTRILSKSVEIERIVQ